MKQCTKCGEEKPLSEFYRHRITKDGLAHVCKDCSRNKFKAFSQTASGLYTAIKSRQKFYKKNQPWRHKPVNLSRDEFVAWFDSQLKECHYCGLSLEDMHNVDDFYNNKSKRMGVDAVKNRLGYELGNLVVCCHRCNGVKSDFFSYDEMVYIGANFVRPKWERMLKGENSES